MSILNKKYIKYPVIIVAVGIIFLIIFDKAIMPWYVSAEEVVVPDFVGQPKESALQALKDLGLEPVEQGPKYDENIPKDHIIFQTPKPGSTVKIGRRIYKRR
jgi:beta-lactam-binding protein with PASTA domain